MLGNSLLHLANGRAGWPETESEKVRTEGPEVWPGQVTFVPEQSNERQESERDTPITAEQERGSRRRQPQRPAGWCKRATEVARALLGSRFGAAKLGVNRGLQGNLCNPAETGLQQVHRTSSCLRGVQHLRRSSSRFRIVSRTTHRTIGDCTKSDGFDRYRARNERCARAEQRKLYGANRADSSAICSSCD